MGYFVLLELYTVCIMALWRTKLLPENFKEHYSYWVLSNTSINFLEDPYFILLMRSG